MLTVFYIVDYPVQANPQTYKRCWGEGMDATPRPPRKVFLSFFLEDKTLAPDVFSSCSFIPHANFETSSVAFSDSQLLWIRDMTLYVAGGQASFG